MAHCRQETALGVAVGLGFNCQPFSDGARALGVGAVTGSLEEGKRADMIAVAIDELQHLPLFCPLSHLVYVASRNDVTDVWVDGRCLLRERTLLTVDEPALRARIAAWTGQIAAFREGRAQAAAAEAVKEEEEAVTAAESK